MAIGWLSVLKMVPWGDVIESAPKVAVGAKKLWNSVGKKSVDASAASASPGDQVEADAPLAALQSQVLELQVAVADLHQQMLESSALIGSLAEQNTQLIQRMELMRKRMLALIVVTLVFCGMLVKLYLK
jgi:hypothetical protein